MRLVLYQGRMVSPYWLNRYVLGKPPARKSPRTIIPALFHMPANLWAKEPAENRLMNLASKTDRRFVENMSKCYAVGLKLSKRCELTTFFPPSTPPRQLLQPLCAREKP